MTQAPSSHYYPWLVWGTGPVSWTQESRPALQGPGLSTEELMCCDRRACLSAFPWQRAAKSNANSQAARRALCLIQFPLLLSQRTTTWKGPLFYIPLGPIALFSTWCIFFQLFIQQMAATLSGRPLNQDYFHRTLWDQWDPIQNWLAGKNCGLSVTWECSCCVWWLSVSATTNHMPCPPSFLKRSPSAKALFLKKIFGHMKTVLTSAAKSMPNQLAVI